MNDAQADRMFYQELMSSMHNLIWQDEDGSYEAFGKYRIVPRRPGFQVWCANNYVGDFRSTRAALSWCIADKFKKYNLARELLLIDNALHSLANDIMVRAGVAAKTKKRDLKECVETKIETKIIRKKELEYQLDKCINLAKYLQQKGFNNETARTGRHNTNKTNR